MVICPDVCPDPTIDSLLVCNCCVGGYGCTDIFASILSSFRFHLVLVYPWGSLCWTHACGYIVHTEDKSRLKIRQTTFVRDRSAAIQVKVGAWIKVQIFQVKLMLPRVSNTWIWWTWTCYDPGPCAPGVSPCGSVELEFHLSSTYPPQYQCGMRSQSCSNESGNSLR